MLAPSIEYITVDDYYGKMSIHGLFGDNSMADGKVTVGGQEVNVPIWGPYLLICDLPATGAGSSGNVIVNVNGHESNIVPLSEWTIPIHIEKDELV